MTSPSPGRPAQIVVGRAGRAHGIKGEVSVVVRTDAPELRFADGVVLTTDLPAPAPATLTVKGTRWHQGRLLVTFDGIADRNGAEAVSGAMLTIDVADAGDAGEGAFWDHQLIGLRALLLDGAEIGVVEDVIHLPANEMLAVRAPDGREVLVPFVLAIVPTVDVEGGWLTIDPPDGLLEL